jgi:hypothetical protein
VVRERRGRTELCVKDPGFEVDFHVAGSLRDMVYI